MTRKPTFNSKLSHSLIVKKKTVLNLLYTVLFLSSIFNFLACLICADLERNS